jgi:hypothetical protein
MNSPPTRPLCLCRCPAAQHSRTEPVATDVLRPFFLCRGLPASAPDTQRFSTTWVASSIGTASVTR